MRTCDSFRASHFSFWLLLYDRPSDSGERGGSLTLLQYYPPLSNVMNISEQVLIEGLLWLTVCLR
jgi:hypothetical protein